MHFARYETPMSVGFRKYASLYRKTATVLSHDNLPARPVRPLIDNSLLLIRAPTPASADVCRITILGNTRRRAALNSA